MDSLIRHTDNCIEVNYTPKYKEKKHPRKISKEALKKLDNDNNFVFMSSKVIKKYVDILKNDRADDYKSWIEIGWIIYNCNPKNGFKIWNEFSMKSYKYDQQSVIYQWNRFHWRRTGMNVGTLKYYAKIDDPVL